VILLYHLLFPDDAPANTWNAGKVIRLSQFIRQVEWLRRHYALVTLEEYLQERHIRKRIAAITFDDGYQKTFELIHDYLHTNQIPVTFFANTSHLEDGKLLWFVTINALCFERVYPQLEIDGRIYPLQSKKDCIIAWRKLIQDARESGDAIRFSTELAARFPLPAEVIQKFSGLSSDQLSMISQSDLLTLGGHTHRHPYLGQLTPEEQLSEMVQNKERLEVFAGRPVPFFAYTGGVYDLNSIQAVKKAGFRGAFAVKPKLLGSEQTFEFPRVDIYSPSLGKFALKTMLHEKVFHTFTDNGRRQNG
jgi:peptidoglycan/xylan/chitin deacetylase (PgdA/CDA1 family)